MSMKLGMYGNLLCMDRRFRRLSVVQTVLGPFHFLGRCLEDQEELAGFQVRLVLQDAVLRSSSITSFFSCASVFISKLFIAKGENKADVAEHLEVFDHVGLLTNEPPGTAELLFI